jgi:glyoxylase-like metal-dependent hydrolase (beta-lactamase superfamily II)
MQVAEGIYKPERATASAEKLRALPLSLVLPGHGAPARLPGGAG